MDEKTIQRIKKLQALAERGVGGEKTTAQKKLAKLQRQLNLTEQHTSHTDGGRKSAYIARKRRKSK